MTAPVTNDGLAVSRGHAIAVDAMGGDLAPGEVVRGAVLAAAELSAQLLLVGREEDVHRELANAPGPIPPNVEVIDAREVVEMGEGALTPIRKKRDSSIRVCANLVKAGRAAAFVSAGNTGAAWTSAKLVLGMIEGVDRPALATVLPRIGGFTLLLDVGANVDVKANNLREFAVMGHFYAQLVFDLEHPRVGLLSIGEEEGKGNELTRETFRVLEGAGLNFIGNAEGRDIYNGNADVIVCDGFTGNVVLKASEALADAFKRGLREELTRNPLRKLGAFLSKGAFEDFRRRVDYEEYGGAPLLGVRGGCIVCHGSSKSKAIKNAIKVAASFAENDINAKIQSKVSDLHSREKAAGILAMEKDAVGEK
ncbi:MAG TPA: phosphate acyltransferase PlsX [Thermoanaerobaculia bacterium]|nr:phosphate acyltransferase PlsX [Thermoanaerobaculia bacterium]